MATEAGRSRARLLKMDNRWSLTRPRAHLRRQTAPTLADVEGQLWPAAREASGRFDTAAVAYDVYRPRYPDAMFDDIMSFGDLQPGDEAIEVGAGTGIATEPLVDCGLAVVAIEPAPTMAELANHKLGDRGEVVVSRFEDWEARRDIGPGLDGDCVLG
jgi:hypothetical protein